MWSHASLLPNRTQFKSTPFHVGFVADAGTSFSKSTGTTYCEVVASKKVIHIGRNYINLK
jgi:hypothetical protein